MFLYRDILKKSIKISWENKYLWFFGLFASLVGGMGNLRMSFSKIDSNIDQGFFMTIVRIVNSGFFSQNIFVNIGKLYAKDPISTIAFLVFSLIFFVLVLFILWLAVVSQVGIINNSAKIINKGGKNIKTSLKEGINAGMKYFWPALGLNLAIRTAMLFLAVIVGLPLIYINLQNGSLMGLIYSLSFIVFIPLVLILSFLLKYSLAFLVVKKEKIIDSIILAWKLFIKNWLISIEMALLFFVVDILFIVLIAVVVLIVAIPYLFIVFGLTTLFSVSLFFVMLLFGLMLSLVILVILGSFLTTLKLTAWTDLFIHISGKGGISKLIRFTEGIKK